MKQIKSFVKRMLKVEYRLCVLYEGAVVPRNTYGMNGHLLRCMARKTADHQYWTLYKKGPFGLPEHEIDCSLWHEKGGNA